MPHISRQTTLFLAICSGIIVANIYYIQPLVPLVAVYFGITEEMASKATYFTQAGYALGLFVLVPLGDMIERRVQIGCATGMSIVAMLAMALAPNFYMLLIFSLLTGFFSTVPQMLIPVAAMLSSPEKRGQTVGTVMSGLLIGVLLSRAASGALGHWLGWQAVYLSGAAICSILLIFMMRLIPATHSHHTGSYAALMRSLIHLLKTEPLLRLSTGINMCCFACFGGFWTTMVLLMHGPPHKLSPAQIGLFGIAAALGALAAPLFGKLSDKKGPTATIGAALMVYLLCIGLLWLSAAWIPGFVAGIVLIDLVQQAVHVSNQTRVYALRPEARNRLNTLFMGGSFIGTAAGSAAGVLLWNLGGWDAVMMGLAAVTLLAISLHFGVKISQKKAVS